MKIFVLRKSWVSPSTTISSNYILRRILKCTMPFVLLWHLKEFRENSEPSLLFLKLRCRSSGHVSNLIVFSVFFRLLSIINKFVSWAAESATTSSWNHCLLIFYVAFNPCSWDLISNLSKRNVSDCFVTCEKHFIDGYHDPTSLFLQQAYSSIFFHA